MLQHVDAGRPIGLDAVVPAVQEISRLVGEPTPFVDAVLGQARLHAWVRGLHR